MKRFLLLLVAIACVASKEETAVTGTFTKPAPPETTETFVPAWQVTSDVYVGEGGWRVECADPAQIVRQVGSRLCSFNLSTQIIVDGDGDGDCDLIPPVDLLVIE